MNVAKFYVKVIPVTVVTMLMLIGIYNLIGREFNTNILVLATYVVASVQELFSSRKGIDGENRKDS